jgi:hypothetical protein
LDEHPVALISALAELGGTYLEVEGKVAVRQSRRVSDLANDEDELLDLKDARLRVHHGAALWDSVSALTLNREEVLMLIPIEEVHADRPDLRAPCRKVRVKVFCGPLQVSGFVSVPIEQTVSSWHRTTRQRFLPMTEARVQPIQDDLKLPDRDGLHAFALINRRRLTALIEASSPRRVPEPAGRRELDSRRSD